MERVELLSVPQMAKKVGCSYNSVKRYIDRFPEFFMFQFIDGVKQFPADRVVILRRIYELYSKGKRSKEIKGILEVEFAKDVDISHDNHSSTTNDIAAPPSEMLQGFMDRMEKLTNSFDRVADLLEKQQGDNTLNETMGAILKVLSTGVTTLPLKDNGGAIEEMLRKEMREREAAADDPIREEVAFGRSTRTIPDIDDPAKNPELPGMPKGSLQDDTGPIPYDEVLIYDLIRNLKMDGMTHRTIAHTLTEDGYLTAKGKTTWHPGSIGNILKKLKERGEL